MIQRFVLSITISLTTLFFLSGCTGVSYKAQKDETLQTSVFGLDGGSGFGNQDGGGSNGNCSSCDDDEEGQSGEVNPDGSVGFVLECSDSDSEDTVNIKEAYSGNMPLEIHLGGQLCTADKPTVLSIIQKKSFLVTDALSICPDLMSDTGVIPPLSLRVGNLNYNGFANTEILYALNDDRFPVEQVADQYCDDRSSPLVIHLNSNPAEPKPILLSSQEDGILFDLLGARNNHEKVQLSWFTNHEYGLLALPAEDGSVNSIDQLFGDNTQGPDGSFAEDGYEALAKYDSTADGRIDSNDPVFSDLRVWVDQNFDGEAQSGELVSLRDAKSTFIDLQYSKDFSESDQYGNLTLMKSVVGRDDGSLDLIFDLWFAFK